MEQEYIKKGFKSQEEYEDYLDKNHLIICQWCENETKEFDTHDIYNEIEKVNDSICVNCFEQLEQCPKCHKFVSITQIYSKTENSKDMCFNCLNGED